MNQTIKQNIGLNERCFRIIISILFFTLTITQNQWWMVAGVLFLVTGIVGWSPLYQMLRVDTNKIVITNIEPISKIARSKVKKSSKHKK